MVRRLTRSVLVLATLAGLAMTAPAMAERGDDSKRKSKNGAAQGTIDGVDINIEYGRPNVNGRQLWGGLVPYGKVWRTGADEATTISFSSDVNIEGQPLPAGTYSLFTVPGEESWEVIFNEVANQWGAFRYDAGKDALRVSVAPATSDSVETLTFAIGDGKVGLHWGDLGVAFSVAAAN